MKRADLSNWQSPPFNRWGFWHVREIVPTERIPRGPGPVTELPHADRGDLAGVSFEYEGRFSTFGEMLAETYTDAIVVINRGLLVHEWYVPNGGPDQPHLLMSVSKSLTSALVGALVDQGRLDTSAEVTAILPRLRGSSFEGATVQHLLDMRTGTKFDETDYDDAESDVWLYDEVCAMSARVHEGLPASIYTYIEKCKNTRPHGGAFEYRSILSDLLGWVATEAGGAGFGELFSREIWAKLGPENDADIGVDPSGFAVVNGYICTTARDLARFGMMFLGLGEIDGRRVLSESWVRRILRPNPELSEAFKDSPQAGAMPNGFYHDCWWVKDPVAGVFAASGINGQRVFVHLPSETVIVKFSTWPRGSDDDLSALTESGIVAVCDFLKDRGA